MAIFIDSAISSEVEAAKDLGWVRGVTTNPLLLAKAGGDPQAVLSVLARLEIGPLFYQLVSSTLEDMHKETEQAAEVVGMSLVLKVPPTQTGFQFVNQCVVYPCCVTAVFSSVQALVAREAGASYVALYVNRATQLLGDGMQLVREVASVLQDSGTDIVAASVKSAEEASAALLAGAHHLTLPFTVLSNLITHPLSEQTLLDFVTNGVGIKS